LLIVDARLRTPNWLQHPQKCCGRANIARKSPTCAHGYPRMLRRTTWMRQEKCFQCPLYAAELVNLRHEPKWSKVLLHCPEKRTGRFRAFESAFGGLPRRAGCLNLT